MAVRDLAHNLVEQVVKDPAATTSTFTGSALDTAGYASVALLLQAGTITDGTHTPKLQESATTVSGDFTDVAAADLLGAFTAMTTGAGNGGSAIQEVGYIGSKRYVRLVVTVSGATTGGVYGAALVAHPHDVPA